MNPLVKPYWQRLMPGPCGHHTQQQAACICRICSSIRRNVASLKGCKFELLLRPTLCRRLVVLLLHVGVLLLYRPCSTATCSCTKEADAINCYSIAAWAQ